MKSNISIYLKRGLFVFALLVLNIPAFGEDDLKALSNYLDQIIENKQQFTKQKEERINSLKQLLTEKEFSPEYEYEINIKLYYEYKKYRLDSAIYYIQRNLHIADSLQNIKFSQLSRIQLGSLFSYSGKHREAEQILKSINSRKLPKDLLPEYYEVYGRFFEHYGALTGQNKYVEYGQYRDSLIAVLDTATYLYKSNIATIYISQSKLDEAEKILSKLFETEEKYSPNYASITYNLGIINKIKNNPDLEKKYFTLSAISDIRSTIKENASFQRLASIYYNSGDIERAFRYTQSAIEDAVFSGVQFRTAEMSTFYSIINASYQQKLASSRTQLQVYVVLISFLSIFLVLLVAYVYKQMRKISVIKEELSLSNGKLIQLNNELNESNDYLFESNHIKEQYIVHFLDLCSDYITKLEDYRKTLNAMALNNQIEFLLKKLRSTTMVDDEIEELYKHFDGVFLGLYPTFVTDFNSLLAEDEQITLKSDDLLNRELRIYALLRLGITDSAKIATFLRCSLSTVYNYRTKIRNKAIVPRDEFEDIVTKIGSIHKSN